MLFSYLIAALVVGVGLLIASAWKLPDDAQVAKSSPAPTKVLLQPKPECRRSDHGHGRLPVGRISVQKSPNPKPKPNPEPSSPSADKYALASGLMEITYDTGAKVILQGPVTYEVESAARRLPIARQADGEAGKER